MSPLPIIGSTTTTQEPIIKSRVDVYIKDINDNIIKILDDNILKIKNNKIYFSSNMKNYEELLDLVICMINKKEVFQIDVIYKNMVGEQFLNITLENCNFISIKNIADFDFSKDDFLKLKVKFKYQNFSYLFDSQTNIDRKLKMKNIFNSNL